MSDIFRPLLKINRLGQCNQNTPLSVLFQASSQSLLKKNPIKLKNVNISGKKKTDMGIHPKAKKKTAIMDVTVDAVRKTTFVSKCFRPINNPTHKTIKIIILSTLFDAVLTPV